MTEIQVIPADDDTTVPVPSKDEKRSHLIGHYQGITVDLETGKFYFDPEDWRQDHRVRQEQQRAACWFPTSDWQPTGRYVRWMLDSGVDEDKSMDPPCPFPYITTAQANALLEELAPVVQQFVDAMIPVPGRPGLWDWSRQAAAVGYAIKRRVFRAQTPVPEVIEPSPWMRNISELAEQYTGFVDAMHKWPHFDRPDQVSDERIKQQAADFACGFVHKSLPGVLETFGLNSEARTDFVVLGVTAFLCGRREEAADGRKVVDASQWFQREPVPDAVIDLDLDRLDEWAGQYNDHLSQLGVMVVGVQEWAALNQKRLRDAVRSEVSRLGQDAREKDRDAQKARQRRNSAISRVLSWGVDEDTDAELGRVAAVSHTTVRNLRTAGDE